MSDWFVGQVVAITSRGSGRIVSLSRVKRIMKRFVECENGSTFNHNGHPYPHAPYSTALLEPATDQHKEKVQRQGLVRYLERQKWERIPTDTLARVAEILKTLTTNEET